MRLRPPHLRLERGEEAGEEPRRPVRWEERGCPSPSGDHRGEAPQLQLLPRLHPAVARLVALEDPTTVVTTAGVGAVGRRVAEASHAAVVRLAAEAAPADLASLGADARTTTVVGVALVVDVEGVQETRTAGAAQMARTEEETLLTKATVTGEGVDVVAPS